MTMIFGWQKFKEFKSRKWISSVTLNSNFLSMNDRLSFIIRRNTNILLTFYLPQVECWYYYQPGKKMKYWARALSNVVCYRRTRLACFYIVGVLQDHDDTTVSSRWLSKSSSRIVVPSNSIWQMQSVRQSNDYWVDVLGVVWLTLCESYCAQ